MKIATDQNISLNYIDDADRECWLTDKVEETNKIDASMNPNGKIDASMNPNGKTNLPWVEKYRPKQLDKIISHKEIIKSLKRFIQFKTLPHLLFFGPSGSGKTSTIMCCANEIYHNYIDCMVLILNASNERGIETVRTKIKNFVSNRNSIFLPKTMNKIFKLVILDEIDSMTVEAQGMLRQTIEKNSSSTRFCLICNDIDKINIALQSRCALFRFSPLNPTDMYQRLLFICEAEHITYNKTIIETLIKISNGDLRFATNMLQQITLTLRDKITIDDIYKISGQCTLRIMETVFNALNGVRQTGLLQTIQQITDMIMDNNITIFNLLEELKNQIIGSDLSLRQKIFLIDHFAKNEVYDAVNIDTKNIIMIITSLFVLVDQIEKN